MPEPFSVAGSDISDAPGDHADDGLVNEWGLKVLGGVLEMEAERAVSDYRRLEIGESVEI